jgi:hypothetical protein
VTFRFQTLIFQATRACLIGALLAFPALTACENHRPVAPLHDGDAACNQLADVCAEPSRLGEPYRSCYETGVNADPNACLDAYNDCISSCANAPDAGLGGASGGSGEGGAPETGGSNATAGAGGEGGAVAAHGGANGA